MASVYKAGGYSAQAIPRLYRELLRSAKLLPAAEQQQALADIRAGFRKNITDTSEAEIDKLLHAGREKLSYLKIVTPRRPSGQAGKTSFILDKDGTFHEGSAGVAGRTLRAGLDSDDLARHRHLLERQHFMHRR